jgi:Carboxypeptidase regulatory-like domain
MRAPLIPTIRGVLLGALLVIGAVAPRAAQATVASPSAVPSTAPSAVADTVRGIVFDSLLKAPLAGLTVMADIEGATSTTDDFGAFVLVTKGTIKRISAFGEFLDRTGIGSLSAVLTAQSNRKAIILATPSIETVRARLCPGVKFEAGREAIIFGSARSAAKNAVLLSGVRIHASWDPGAPGDDPDRARVVDVKTDSTGNYYLCSVPPIAPVYVIAYSQQYNSGTIAVPGDSVPLRKQDLVLGAAGKMGTVRGVVRDTRRQGITTAIVDIDGVEIGTGTDSQGRFVIPNVPAGSRSLMARAIGYSPVITQVDVTEDNAPSVTIELTKSVFLPGVKVTERTAVPMMKADYEERKKLGFGTFIDTAQINTLYNTRSIFQGRAGLMIEGNPPQMTLYMSATTGYCQPTVKIDGFTSDTQILVDYPKSNIAAVEIYTKASLAPAKYAPIMSSCGLILIWSKGSFAR